MMTRPVMKLSLAVCALTTMLSLPCLAQGIDTPCSPDSVSGCTPPPNRDMTLGYAHGESKLQPSEGSAISQPWNPNASSIPQPPIMQRRVSEHRDFIQPFLTPAVFPEISARLLNGGGYGSRGHAAELDQFLYLSAYLIDVYAPLLTLRHSAPVSPDTLRMNLKAPLIFGRHAFTLFVGGNLPTGGPWTDGGYNMMFGYALGGSLLSLQARVGFGFDQLIGEEVGPRASSVLGDVAASVSLGQHARFLVQADGRKILGQQGGTFRLWPGFRFYPLEEATLSFAVGAQLYMDSFTPSGAFTSFDVRRAGAFFDIGYVFF